MGEAPRLSPRSAHTRLSERDTHGGAGIAARDSMVTQALRFRDLVRRSRTPIEDRALHLHRRG